MFKRNIDVPLLKDAERLFDRLVKQAEENGGLSATFSPDTPESRKARKAEALRLRDEYHSAQREMADIEKTLDETLTPHQRELKARWKLAQSEPYYMGSNELSKAQDAFRESFDHAQKAIDARISDRSGVSNRIAMQLMQLSGGLTPMMKIIHSKGEDCPLPERIAPQRNVAEVPADQWGDSAYRSGVRRAINMALAQAIIGKPNFTIWSPDYAIIKEDPGKLIFELQGEPSVDVERVRSVLSKTFAREFADPARWATYTTQDGTKGYSITTQHARPSLSYDDDLVFSTVYSMAKRIAPTAKSDGGAEFEEIADGQPPADRALNARTDRSPKQLDSQNPSPRIFYESHDGRWHLDLSKDQAEPILAALGVDKKKIKPFSARSR